jgi:hypothetical protein
LKEEHKKEIAAYDPEQVWTIEGPNRRQNDMAKRQADTDWTKHMLEQ